MSEKFLFRLSSLKNQCVEVIDIIEKYKTYFQFKFLRSTPLQEMNTTEYPFCVHQSADDQYFISITHAGAVYHYDTHGNLLKRIKVAHPLQLCVDDNELFVVNYRLHQIEVYSLQGLLLRTFIVQFSTGIAIYNSSVIVATHNGMVYAFTKKGQQMWQQQIPLMTTARLSIDKKNGDIYYFGNYESKIGVLDRNGKFLRQFYLNQQVQTRELHITAVGELFILSHARTSARKEFMANDDYIFVYTTDGTYKRTEKIDVKESVFTVGIQGQLIFVNRDFMYFFK